MPSRKPATEWRSVSQMVTIARFRRPANPKRCNVHAYHVWRWKTVADDPNFTPFLGMTCQCGCLTWTPQDRQITPEIANG